MKVKLLQEHIGRVGIVTRQELLQQTGAAANLLWEPLVHLIEEKEVFYCRMVRGEQTLLSRHLFLCLHAVRTEPELSEEAQDLYDWLSDNETACSTDMRAAYEAEVGGDWYKTLHELEQDARIAPIKFCGSVAPGKDFEKQDVDLQFELVWVTDEYWNQGVPHPPRYGDLEYDITEVRKLLKSHYSTREIDAILYNS